MKIIQESNGLKNLLKRDGQVLQERRKTLSDTQKKTGRRLQGWFAFCVRYISLCLVALFYVLLTGCAGTEYKNPVGGKGTALAGAGKNSSAVSAAETFSGQNYTVTDDAGHTVTLKGKPKRIVSVTYGTDEILKVLTGPKRIVAYSRYAGDPEISFLSRQDIAQVGCQAQENAETIYALQPDLVVVSTASPPDMVSALEQLGVPVYTAGSPKNVDQMKQKVYRLGLAVGEEEKTKALLRRMDERLAALDKRLSVITDRKRKVAVAFTMSGPMGRKGDLFDSMLRAAHVINGAAVSHPLGIKGQISKEHVVEINPDIFILPTWNYDPHQDTHIFNREIAEDPAFSNVKAVKNKQLLPISDRYRYVASHHIVDAIENIAYTVYPEVFPEGRPVDQE